MADTTLTHHTPDEHRAIVAEQGVLLLRAFYAMFADIDDLRVDGDRLTFRTGPTRKEPTIPRRQVAITVTVTVEEESNGAAG